VNGALVARSEARVSIDDFGARYGAVCFETMLARQGVVFRLDAHLERLERGLRLLGTVGPSRSAIRAAIDETLAANDLRDASVRLAVSAGEGRAPDLRAASGPVTTITVDHLPPALSPARLRISSIRVDERRPWRDAKVGQYLPYLLAREEARTAGADDALLLNYAGQVAEASTANVLLVLDDAIVVPDAASGALPGITSAAVLQVARDLRIRAGEASVTLDHIARASAIILASSVMGLRDVASIEGGELAEGFRWTGGEATAALVVRLREAYESCVSRECESS
jgi:branched-subunit amino acid aminotransferase/4-amino-4-deoxychorismate lyase